MRAVRVRGRHFNGRQPSGLISMIRLQDKSSSGGAYARDKNTSAGLCAKNAGGGAYARGGAYLRDTTVIFAHRYPRYSDRMNFPRIHNPPSSYNRTVNNTRHLLQWFNNKMS